MEAVIIKTIPGKLTTLIRDEKGSLSGVDGAVRKLQYHLEWMSESIKYADEKRRSDPLVRKWVGDIRKIAFDAEDAIEEFIVHLQRLEQQHKERRNDDMNLGFGSLKSVFSTTKQLTLPHEFGIRIRGINDELQKLSTMGATLVGGFGTSANNISSTATWQEKIKSRRAAIAVEEYQDAANIHENSARKITDSLMGKAGNGDQKRLRIISVVGMGGVGKTTLAKRVYHNDIVMQNFETFAFVYVSQTYDLNELLRSLLKQFSSVPNEEEVSCSKLRNYLQGNKYLILLDDIWDTVAWDGFKSAFPDENNGSRVLLTTRLKDVAWSADSSCSSNIHELGVITENESWELFLKKTFPSGSTRGASQKNLCPKELVNLGKQMVNKCHGLPLAIVMVGSLLSREERSEHVWSRVNSSVNSHLSQSEDHSYKCSGILALSYYDLPYYLKPCFLYMSLFPEDREIRATKLFQYWIAEGFVEKNGPEEDVAEKYLEELISRSLIQVDRLRCDGRVKTCRINKLLRDIAIAESKEDGFSHIFSGVQEYYLTQSNVRRVAVYNTAFSGHSFTESRHVIAVRSLMCRGLQFLHHNYLDSLFGGFKLLRVLEFSSSTGLSTGRFPSLPKELGELVNLRYLSLEDTRLERLNTSYLRKLVNLQVLNLNRCGTTLTSDDQIGSLHQLRHLYLGGLSHNISDTSTAFNHLGIGNLTNLKSLRIEAGDWIYGGALKRLSFLKKLRIDGCSSAHSTEISDAIVILVGLKSLMLQSQTNHFSTERVPLTFIEFASHTDLKKLLLKGELRGWTGTISFPPNLTKLILEESRIFTDPMVILETLPKLTFLHLGINSYVGKEMVCSEGGFVSLQTLRLVSLENVQQWIVKEGALVKLAYLEILLCEKMKTFPVKQLISLQKLTVNGTHYTTNQWLEEQRDYDTSYDSTKKQDQLDGQSELYQSPYSTTAESEVQENFYRVGTDDRFVFPEFEFFFSVFFLY
ncbi:hypothetical protein MKW94_014275 [Papaver nudicaule]|uniref:Uncharacterized protein n=1 Tax=Papaver nudicaule TaxID=74823 RepID=A0AA41RQ31_PAPNU|nr:hypothetical protein [Papaver nudicaule]